MFSLKSISYISNNELLWLDLGCFLKSIFVHLQQMFLLWAGSWMISSRVFLASPTDELLWPVFYCHRKYLLHLQHMSCCDWILDVFFNKKYLLHLQHVSCCDRILNVSFNKKYLLRLHHLNCCDRILVVFLKVYLYISNRCFALGRILDDFFKSIPCISHGWTALAGLPSKVSLTSPTCELLWPDLGWFL